MNTNDRAFYDSMLLEGIDSKQTLDIVTRELYLHFSHRMRDGYRAFIKACDGQVQYWMTALSYYAEAKVWADLYLDTISLARACAVDDPRLPQIVSFHEAMLEEYAELTERISATIVEKALANAIGE